MRWMIDRAGPGTLRVLMLTAALLVVALRPSVAHATKLTIYPLLATWYEYNDNLLATAEESDEEKLADSSITVQPALRVRYESVRTEAEIGGQAAFQWFFNEQSENGLPDLVEGHALYGVWLTPSTRIEASDDLGFFFDSRDTIGTQSQELLQVQTASITNTIGLGLTHIFDLRNQVAGKYEFVTNEYEDEDLADVVTHRPTIEYEHRVSPVHTIVVFGRFTRNIFDPEFDFLRRIWDSDARMDEEFPTELRTDNDFDTYVPGVGLDYRMTATLSFSVRSGMIVPARLVDNSYQLDELEWYQVVSAEKNWQMVRLGVGYERDLEPASGINTAVLSQNYNADLTEVWTRKFETSQNAYFNRATQLDGDFDTYAGAVAANYYIAPWIGIGAGYQHIRQYSDLGADDTETITNRALFTLEISTPQADSLSLDL
ncbi:MAG: hypothetical protein H6684_07540 [Deltaproteobacteria bacterium]|nr:hypothetical protein [Deltaproteobacteria bacterium]MCB9488565.1 hypothetical protein [Deltaproteobacteria bacterium]